MHEPKPAELGVLIATPARRGDERPRIVGHLWLESLLYGVSPLDASTWLLAVCSLLAAGALAALVPALRAARVAPSVAMRGD